jgi:hypothetical protein
MKKWLIIFYVLQRRYFLNQNSTFLEPKISGKSKSNNGFYKLILLKFFDIIAIQVVAGYGGTNAAYSPMN